MTSETPTLSSPGVRGRRRSGVHETPEVVARFLCRAALREYLVTHLVNDGEEEAARQQAAALLPAGTAAGEPSRVGPSSLSAQEALRLRQAVLGCRVCDPAAGDGALLAAMLREMRDLIARLDAVLHREPDPEEGSTAVGPALRLCLHGVDVQEQAVRRCRANLGLADGQVACADSLLEPVFGFPAEGDGFDIVIANPPYVSFGLRGVGPAAHTWARTIRARYPGSAEYKLSTYTVFMDRCLALTRPGGICCCLTPDSYLLGRYFCKLRRRLLDGSAIRALVLIEEDFWKGVVGRPVVGVFRAGRRAGEMPRIVATRYRTVADLAAGRGDSCACAQSDFETAPRHRFRLLFAEDDRRFVAAMERGAGRLGDVVTFASGLIGRHGRASIVSPVPLGPAWRPGIDSGADVLPYRVRYRGRHLHFSPLALKSGFREARYDVPKLLLRQTGDALVAAFDPDGLYCLNNAHVGNARRPDLDVRVAVAILNSRLLNRYYRLISLEAGRPLAQVDLDVVEGLPFKAPTAAEACEIVELVSMLQAGPAGDTAAAVRRLENLVRRVYLGEDAAAESTLPQEAGFR